MGSLGSEFPVTRLSNESALRRKGRVPLPGTGNFGFCIRPKYKRCSEFILCERRRGVRGSVPLGCWPPGTLSGREVVSACRQHCTDHGIPGTRKKSGVLHGTAGVVVGVSDLQLLVCYSPSAGMVERISKNCEFVGYPSGRYRLFRIPEWDQAINSNHSTICTDDTHICCEQQGRHRIRESHTEHCSSCKNFYISVWLQMNV